LIWFLIARRKKRVEGARKRRRSLQETPPRPAPRSTITSHASTTPTQPHQSLTQANRAKRAALVRNRRDGRPCPLRLFNARHARSDPRSRRSDRDHTSLARLKQAWAAGRCTTAPRGTLQRATRPTGARRRRAQTRNRRLLLACVPLSLALSLPGTQGVVPSALDPLGARSRTRRVRERKGEGGDRPPPPPARAPTRPRERRAAPRQKQRKNNPLRASPR
jgi:hypothetical protein